MFQNQWAMNRWDKHGNIHVFTKYQTQEWVKLLTERKTKNLRIRLKQSKVTSNQIRQTSRWSWCPYQHKQCLGIQKKGIKKNKSLNEIIAKRLKKKTYPGKILLKPCTPLASSGIRPSQRKPPEKIQCSPKIPPCSYLLWQATTCPIVPRISSMALQSPAWPLPSWLAAHPISCSCFHAERGPPTCLGCCQLLVMRRHLSNVIIYI